MLRQIFILNFKCVNSFPTESFDINFQFYLIGSKSEMFISCMINSCYSLPVYIYNITSHCFLIFFLLKLGVRVSVRVAVYPETFIMVK